MTQTNGRAYDGVQRFIKDNPSTTVIEETVHLEMLLQARQVDALEGIAESLGVIAEAVAVIADAYDSLDDEEEIALDGH